MVSATLGCVGGRINQEVCVKSIVIDHVALYHDTIVKVLSGVSGLLPSYVAECVVEQLLLEADHRPPLLRLADAEGGQLGEAGLYNLEIFRLEIFEIIVLCLSMGYYGKISQLGK